MSKTIETCKVIEKRDYYYGKPEKINGKCKGYESEKRPYDLLAVCKKCKFLYQEN